MAITTYNWHQGTKFPLLNIYSFTSLKITLEHLSAISVTDLYCQGETITPRAINTESTLYLPQQLIDEPPF